MRGTVPANVEITKNWMGQSNERWRQHVLPLKETLTKIRLIEIGVFEGLSACWWLDNLLTGTSDFYLGIDPWLPHPDLGRRRQEDLDAIRARAETNVSRYGDKAMLWHGTSVDAFRPAPELAQILLPESFEVAYIDGDHGPAAAMLDSANVWSLIRPGGIIVWDDWQYDLHRTKYPLHIYLRSFLRLITGKYEILWETFQLGIRKLG